MKLKKHSYILSKDGFILCVLLIDTDYYAGEILYGQVPIDNCPVKIIDGVKYFKYWFLQHKDRKIFGNVGEKTKYVGYYESINLIYKKFTMNHPFIGQLFRVDKDRIERTWTPIEYDNLTQKYSEQGLIIKKLSKILNIEPKYLNIGGSNMLDLNHMSKQDFDIIINSKEQSAKMVTAIRRLTSDELYWINTNNKHIHHRRFMFDTRIICPFGWAADDFIFEISQYKLVKPPTKIEAIVTDDSESLLSPSRYRIVIDNEELLLISYSVGHTALLKKGDKIKLVAPQYVFRISDKLIKSVVIPVEGTWININ
jgi:predicted nucleotidyltransferase